MNQHEVVPGTKLLWCAKRDMTFLAKGGEQPCPYCKQQLVIMVDGAGRVRVTKVAR